MSQSSGDRKSRRRFLADMLFLGGGLTAAGMLAKYQLASPPNPEPSVAGEMTIPTPAPTPEASKTPHETKECHKESPPTATQGTQCRKPPRKPADPFVGKTDPPARDLNKRHRRQVPEHQRRDPNPDIAGMFVMPDPPARH